MPLGGTISLFGAGRWIGARGAILIACSTIGLTLLTVGALIYEAGLSRSPVYLGIGEWVGLPTVGTGVSLSVDGLTVSMLLPVSLVSFLVHLYSRSYMWGDPHLPRFFALLQSFTLAMILLVTSDSLLLLFAGWEGVGLCSYLLVSFWFTRVAASLSALRAFLMNRVGDLALTLLMVGALVSLGEGSLPTLLGTAPYLSEGVRDTATLLLVIGATAKSAQLGLHTWLPAAMEGPTPVSALIHAATMVTAGIYLLLRFSPLVGGSETGLGLLVILGGLTALYGALSGTVESDLKRVIAYSTVSQLGYMTVALGLSAGGIALLHLVNHAFFKALLFLSAGALLHAVGDEQDLRRMGGLSPLLPRISSALLVGSLSLLALPYLTGFYSKDPILEVGAMGGTLTSRLGYLATLGAALLTALYSVRMALVGLVLPPRFSRSRASSLPAGDATGLLLLPLVVLGVLSVIGGLLVREPIGGLGSPFLGGAVYSHPERLLVADSEWLPTPMRFLPLVPLLLFALLLPTRRAGYGTLRERGTWSRASRVGARLMSGGSLVALGLTDWTLLGGDGGDILLLGSALYLAHPLSLLTVALLLTVVLIGVLLLLV